MSLPADVGLLTAQATWIPTSPLHRSVPLCRFAVQGYGGVDLALAPSVRVAGGGGTGECRQASRPLGLRQLRGTGRAALRVTICFSSHKSRLYTSSALPAQRHLRTITLYGNSCGILARIICQVSKPYRRNPVRNFCGTSEFEFVILVLIFAGTGLSSATLRPQLAVVTCTNYIRETKTAERERNRAADFFAPDVGTPSPLSAQGAPQPTGTKAIVVLAYCTSRKRLKAAPHQVRLSAFEA